MSSTAFSQYVMSVEDLYNVGVRNGYYLPKRSSSAVNELMLVNVLKNAYWCPKATDIRLKNCVKAPVKESLLGKLETLCYSKNLNISWISVEKNQLPDKKWLVDVIATLNPEDEIFKKDYIAPPVRRRQRDIETIALPNQIFEGLPPSTSKVKARRLKITSEAFAAERAARLKDVQREIADQIIEHEMRRDELERKLKAR
jgi:hypothetical protein